MDPGQLESQADARSPTGHVVVQVPVQAFEAGIDVGRQCDEQDVDVRQVESEDCRLAIAQTELGSPRFPLVGAVLDRIRDLVQAGLHSGARRPASSSSTVASARYRPRKRSSGSLSVHVVGPLLLNPRRKDVEPGEKMIE